MKILVKFLSLLILPIIVVILTVVYLNSQKNQVMVVNDSQNQQKILAIPYQNNLYQDFGSIYTPTINLAVKTLDGFTNFNFLIDTGAIVSAIPAKESKNLGINLAFLPRVAVEGYGGQTSFTYRGSFTIKLMDDLVTLPCVFSEFDNYNYILGRKGIFENYTLNFNAEKKAVEFSRKI